MVLAAVSLTALFAFSLENNGIGEFCLRATNSPGNDFPSSTSQ